VKGTAAHAFPGRAISLALATAFVMLDLHDYPPLSCK
jgi:hypothetical protein